jgi:hypothetical protein
VYATLSNRMPHNKHNSMTITKGNIKTIATAWQNKRSLEPYKKIDHRL